MAMRRLGFLGLGHMGGGMVKSLLRAGFPVLAFDPKSQLMQAAVKDGAEAAKSPADVAARSEVVLSSLPDPAAVRAAALGPQGLVESIGRDQVSPPRGLRCWTCRSARGRPQRLRVTSP